MTQKHFVVPHWIKIAFFWFSCVLLLLIVAMQVDKRLSYKRLFLSHTMKAKEVLEKAPDFVLPIGTSQKTFTFSKNHGTWRLVHFWATWCPPCREEMPQLMKFSKQMGKELSILAISIDEDFAAVKRFLKADDHKMVLLWDKGEKVAKSYGVFEFPESFLINPQGEIVAHYKGTKPWDRPEIVEMMKESIHKRAS